jgi:hypothetical protein
MWMESVQITLAVLSVNVLLDTLEMDSHVKVKLMFCNLYLILFMAPYIVKRKLIFGPAVIHIKLYYWNNKNLDVNRKVELHLLCRIYGFFNRYKLQNINFTFTCESKLVWIVFPHWLGGQKCYWIRVVLFVQKCLKI